MPNLPYKIIIPLAVGLILGAYLMHKFGPAAKPEVITKTETVHDVKVEKVNVNKVITRTIKEADGDVINEVIHEEDKSVISDDKTTKIELKYALPVRVNVMAMVNMRSRDFVKGLLLEKQITPRLSLGAMASDNGVVGLTLGVSF